MWRVRVRHAGCEHHWFALELTFTKPVETHEYASDLCMMIVSIIKA